MKKVLLILLVLLAIFAFASCKQEPENAEPTPEPEPAIPAEPEYVDPIEEPGVLFVRPAEGATYSQSGKFQFKLDVTFNANEQIDLYAKFSSDITSVAVRQGGGDNAKFKVNGNEAQNLKDLERDENGWYIVSIPAASVIPTSGKTETTPGTPETSWLGLGITAYTNAKERANCFIAIKGLKLNGEYFDITNWDETTCAQTYYTSPSALDIYLTPPAEAEE